MLLRNAFWLVAVFSLLFGTDAHATLSFDADATESGVRYIIVSGEFELSDDLTPFSELVRVHDPSAVTFQSGGGNPFKAMELGRLIRRHGLITIQTRRAECASACALAFLGGIQRFAQPGSIGVHQSSFADDAGLDADMAVSAIQRATAEIMSYISEIGADPALVQLALQYDSEDIRYLSGSEMAQYRVTSNEPREGVPMAPTMPIAPPPRTSAEDLRIPEARSGLIRHPRGSVILKAEPDEDSQPVAQAQNGAPVSIIGNTDRWYRVQLGASVGYAHHSWVWVDQFEGGNFEDRYVQIKSLRSYVASEAFVQASTIPLSVHLATNGWFAITLKETFPDQLARRELERRKDQLPADSFVTYGNTYVRKVCCD
jgi:hypothetical protein